MTIKNDHEKRRSGKCELCGGSGGIDRYQVGPGKREEEEQYTYLCEVCRGEIEDLGASTSDRWRCLSNSMWSEYSAVQVLSYRILKHFENESWARECLEQVYFDEELQSWADANLFPANSVENISKSAVDSNGAPLLEGDSVTLIKDLDVKGANFTAKRGTLVKKIILTDDPGLIEGKVGGVHIVLKTCFLKKVNI